MRCMLLVTVVLSFFQEMVAQNVGIGTNDPQAQLHVHGNQTGQGNVLFTGEAKISNPGPPPTSGPGTRMMWYPDKAAFRAGAVFGVNWDADSIGFFSAAFGMNTRAVHDWSFAVGLNCVAYGQFSVAMGNQVISNVGACLSIGRYNNPIVLPMEGVTGTSPLFIIGNGTGPGQNERKNALAVLANGRMGIDGANDPAYRLSLVDNNLGIDRPATNTMAFYTNGVERIRINPEGSLGIGANSPAYRLSLVDNNLGIDRPAANTMAFYTNGTERLRLTSNGRVGIGLTNPGAPLEVSNENAMIRITNPTGGTTGIEFLRSGGGDDWRLHNTGGLITLSRSTNDLGSVTDHYVFTQSAFRPAVDNTQTVGQGNFRWVSVHATNGTIQTSDARLKENIQPLNYGLQTVAQLRPVSYRWKDNPAGDAHLGFLAQEVQALIPEAVHDAGNSQPLGMQYSELIPVLVKAIQEQEALMETMKATIEKLNARIEILETINKK
jgi:hypothetical protein